MVGSSKKRLRDWRQRIELIRTQVSDRATRFHELARQLEERSARLESRIIVPESEVDAIEVPAKELESLVEPLRQLIGRADVLTEQLNRLESQTSGVGDVALAAWLSRRIGDWRTALAGLGRRSADNRILGQEIQWLEQCEMDFGLLAQLCSELRKVSDLLTAQAFSEETSALTTELTNARNTIRDELSSGGRPAQIQIDRLRSLAQPLERMAAQIFEARGRLEGLGEKLQELRGWSRKLNDSFRQQIQALDERRTGLALKPTGEEREATEKWLAEAEAIRVQLVEQAAKERTLRLDALQTSLSDLAGACGPQPELTARIAELRSAAIDQNHQHSEWQTKLDRYESSFKSIAQNHELALEQRLRSQVARLLEKLARLKATTLSAKAGQDAQLIEHDLGQLNRLSGLNEVMVGLRQVQQLDRQIDELHERAERELRELREKGEALERRFFELRAEESRLNLEFDDLGPEIKALVASSKQLEFAAQDAVELEGRVERRHQEFLDLCRKRVAAHEKASIRAASLLEQADETVTRPVEHLEIADSATPAEAVAHALAADRVRSELEAEVQTNILKFEGKRGEIADQLEKLPLAQLGPSERADADQLLRELKDGSWAHVAGIERLELLAELVNKCELLLARLYHDRDQATRQRLQLEARLRHFDEAFFRRYFPELVVRVEALIHGLPESPRNWKSALHQLSLADGLLKRLEHHGRRLAAAELAKSIEILKARPESHSDSALRQLLGKLDDLDPHQLPATSLRMRLRQAAERFKEVS